MKWMVAFVVSKQVFYTNILQNRLSLLHIACTLICDHILFETEI